MLIYITQAILITLHKIDFSSDAVPYLTIKIFISHYKILVPQKDFTVFETCPSETNGSDSFLN